MIYLGWFRKLRDDWVGEKNLTTKYTKYTKEELFVRHVIARRGFARRSNLSLDHEEERLLRPKAASQ